MNKKMGLKKLFNNLRKAQIILQPLSLLTMIFASPPPLNMSCPPPSSFNMSCPLSCKLQTAIISRRQDPTYEFKEF